MKSSLLNVIYKIASIMGVRVLFTNKPATNEVPDTAVKSKFGFWYIGDLFNRADIAYGIFQNGSVEEDETDAFLLLLDLISKRIHSPIVYDVGAHTGYYSLLSAIHNNEAKVYAFEPVKTFFDTTDSNIKLNNLADRVQAFPVGLSDTNGTASISLAGSGSSLNADMSISTSSEHIQISKLDSLIEEKQIPTPHLLKVDVESHELAMLNGMENVLDSVRPVFFMEVIKTNNGKTNTDLVATFKKMKSHNYIAYKNITIENKITFELFDIDTATDISRLEMYTFIPSEDSLNQDLPKRA